MSVESINETQCLLCDAANRVSGCTLAHIQEHLKYYKNKCNTCDFKCVLEDEAVLHQMNTGHTTKRSLNKYKELLSHEIFIDCVRSSKIGLEKFFTELSSKRRRIIVKSKINRFNKGPVSLDSLNASVGQDEQSNIRKRMRNSDDEERKDVEEKSARVTDPTENNFQNEMSGNVSFTELENDKAGFLFSKEPTSSKCHICNLMVGVDYQSRRSHALNNHLSSKVDITDNDLANQVKSCFPGGKIYSDYQCQKCGKIYKSNNGRKEHVQREHIDARIYCIILGCTYFDSCPSELKKHIKKGHKVSLSKEESEPLYRSFHCAKTKFFDQLRLLVTDYFPYKIPESCSSTELSLNHTLDNCALSNASDPENRENKTESVNQKETRNVPVSEEFDCIPSNLSIHQSFGSSETNSHNVNEFHHHSSEDQQSGSSHNIEISKNKCKQISKGADFQKVKTAKLTKETGKFGEKIWQKKSTSADHSENVESIHLAREDEILLKMSEISLESFLNLKQPFQHIILKQLRRKIVEEIE